MAEIEHQDLELQALKREAELARAAQRRADAEHKSAEAKADEIAKLIRGLDQLTDFPFSSDNRTKFTSVHINFRLL